jgi:hypothetical protein
VSDKYKLVGHEAVPVEDLIEWAMWFEKSGRERLVALDATPHGEVYTYFMGLDFQMYPRGGKKQLFETLVMGGPLDGKGDRYSTWDEAEDGHKIWVEQVKKEG